MLLKKLSTLPIFLLMYVASSNAPPTLADKAYAEMVPSYDLTVKILPESHRLEVSGTVRLPAMSSPQESISLLLSDQMRDFRVKVINPVASAGGAKIEAKAKSGGRVLYAVIPAKPLTPNEPVLLRFSYEGGEKGGFVFYLGAEGSFAHGHLSAWYPLLNAGGYIGHVGTLKFTVPAGHAVAATGKSVSDIKEMAQGVYRFEVMRPAVFSFAAGKYTIARQVEKPLVTVYLLRARPNTEEYLKNCSKILHFLEQQFGRYPHDEFSLAEVPTERASGFFGASSPGLVFIPSKFIDSKFDYSLHGHEIGHQWWGGTIGIKGAKGSQMLSEGLAQFGSLLTVENLEGADSALRYRLTGYPSIGSYSFTPCEGKSIPVQSLYGYLMMTTTGNDRPLDSLGGPLAHSLANSKGFLVLDLLSRTIGREKFSRILTEFTRRHAYREVVWEEFLQAIDAGAGSEMKWFYEQWFERTGAPDLNLTWKQENKIVSGVITQAAPFYQAKVEIQIEGDSDRQRVVKSVDVRGAQTEFTLPTDFHVRSVVLDPQYLLPRWTPAYRAEAAAIIRCSQK